MIVAGTAWGFWQGIGSSVAADAKNRQIAGASFVGTSTAGLISMGAALRLDVPPMKTALAVSGGFWGGVDSVLGRNRGGTVFASNYDAMPRGK
ncbi:MAG: hypothetical protein HYT87_17005 [Nitrospirae bacterium]|nr:hypothetical protein [Nitrospirota bacterium]